jgi:hypothetical protein
VRVRSGKDELESVGGGGGCCRRGHGAACVGADCDSSSTQFFSNPVRRSTFLAEMCRPRKPNSEQFNELRCGVADDLSLLAWDLNLIPRMLCNETPYHHWRGYHRSLTQSLSDSLLLDFLLLRANIKGV